MFVPHSRKTRVSEFAKREIRELRRSIHSDFVIVSIMAIVSIFLFQISSGPFFAADGVAMDVDDESSTSRVTPVIATVAVTSLSLVVASFLIPGPPADRSFSDVVPDTLWSGVLRC